MDDQGMQTVHSVYETKAHLSELIARVEREGKGFVISRHGKPVADVVPHRRPRKTLAPDPALKGAVFQGDPTAPLADADWPEALR